MNRNILYIVIGALAVAAGVFGYHSIRSGRRLPASRSMSGKAAFPSKRNSDRQCFDV